MVQINANDKILRPWMSFVLIFAGCFNILAGLAMISLYHEGYEMLGLERPQLVLPVQVMGVLVGLFGVGYLLVAHDPVQNRHILTLGFLSKAISSIFAMAAVDRCELPVWFLPVLFFADIIYLPLFALIMRRIYRRAAEAPHK